MHSMSTLQFIIIIAKVINMFNVEIHIICLASLSMHFHFEVLRRKKDGIALTRRKVKIKKYKIL